MLRLKAALHSAFVVVPGGHEMRQYPGAVNALPLKGVTGHFIEFIPAYLCGHEIADTAFFHDLRQSRGIAEHIRQPQDLIVLSELIPEEAFAVYELTNQRLTGGNVAVSFHEHTALHFPAAFLHPLLDLLIDFRRVFLYIFVELGLAGHEDVFRISAHKLQYRGKASHSFILCHLKCPQPCTVYVGMSHAVDISIAVPAVFAVKFPGNILLCLFQTLIVFPGAFFSEVQQIQGFIQAVKDGQICPVILRQKSCHLIRYR